MIKHVRTVPVNFVVDTVVTTTVSTTKFTGTVFSNKIEFIRLFFGGNR